MGFDDTLDEEFAQSILDFAEMADEVQEDCLPPLEQRSDAISPTERAFQELWRTYSHFFPPVSKTELLTYLKRNRDHKTRLVRALCDLRVQLDNILKLHKRQP